MRNQIKHVNELQKQEVILEEKHVATHIAELLISCSNWPILSSETVYTATLSYLIVVSFSKYWNVLKSRYDFYLFYFFMKIKWVYA